MNKKLKNALKEGFEAPAPEKKKEFLRNIQAPSISYFEVVCLQVSYIRKWIWVLSVSVFAIALISAEYFEKNILWCISAFMPMIALAVITESRRSETYGMAEFELSTRFSLKSVVLARLGILGITNLILVCLLIPLAFMNSEATILQTSVYMLCPYLLTSFLGLWVVRKVHSKEANYLCTGIAMVISVGNIIIYNSLPLFYEQNSFIWWIVALIIFVVGTVNQCYQMIKQTEELVWNL